jgi:hypothetical protein
MSRLTGVEETQTGSAHFEAHIGCIAMASQRKPQYCKPKEPVINSVMPEDKGL